MIVEDLPNGHRWLRICDADWQDPTDDSFAQRRGGRWNPPDSWRTLYVNEDLVTARLNLEGFIADWPYEPEDLRSDAGPHLAVVTLPRDQAVADAHSPEGVAALGLPSTYPLDRRKQVVEAGRRGVRCRSARAPHGAGREVAWFPATARSRARLIDRLPFDDWYWS